MRYQGTAISLLIVAIYVWAWLAGIVLAKGLSATIIAIFIPFYGWYLLTERIMQMAGIV